ncbi:unnamed protein product, partial [Pocillopora meandrina]
LRRPRFHYIPQISCTTWCQIQTFGFVNASILHINIGDVKLKESADQLAQFGALQRLTRLITLETFRKLIVEAGGYKQRAQISERGSSRELFPIRHKQNKKARYSC